MATTTTPEQVAAMAQQIKSVVKREGWTSDASVAPSMQQILGKLTTLKVDVGLLKETNIGAMVRKLTKHDDEIVRGYSTSLMKKWMQQVGVPPSKDKDKDRSRSSSTHRPAEPTATPSKGALRVVDATHWVSLYLRAILTTVVRILRRRRAAPRASAQAPARWLRVRESEARLAHSPSAAAAAHQRQERHDDHDRTLAQCDCAAPHGAAAAREHRGRCASARCVRAIRFATEWHTVRARSHTSSV